MKCRYAVPRSWLKFLKSIFLHQWAGTLNICYMFVTVNIAPKNYHLLPPRAGLSFGWDLVWTHVVLLSVNKSKWKTKTHIPYPNHLQRNHNFVHGIVRSAFIASASCGPILHPIPACCNEERRQQGVSRLICSLTPMPLQQPAVPMLKYTGRTRWCGSHYF